jgi:hypothetical protein
MRKEKGVPTIRLKVGVTCLGFRARREAARADLAVAVAFEVVAEAEAGGGIEGGEGTTNGWSKALPRAV